ncbi:Uncharacterized protein HZ326_22396 [Fusarium oxysporum f. sp. albedinis]|nr:Uncharacterized protein HZ326_22396 [Fusarium oxysporum f. sp. albedinis]
MFLFCWSRFRPISIVLMVGKRHLVATLGKPRIRCVPRVYREVDKPDVAINVSDLSPLSLDLWSHNMDILVL